MFNPAGAKLRQDLRLLRGYDVRWIIDRTGEAF